MYVNSNDYLIYQNQNGVYSLLLGGEGLSAHNLIDLMNKLKVENKIPITAEIIPTILPSAPTPEMKMQGINEITTQSGDLIITTMDGQNYIFKDSYGHTVDLMISGQYEPEIVDYWDIRTPNIFEDNIDLDNSHHHKIR